VSDEIKEVANFAGTVRFGTDRATLDGIDNVTKETNNGKKVEKENAADDKTITEEGFYKHADNKASIEEGFLNFKTAADDKAITKRGACKHADEKARIEEGLLNFKTAKGEKKSVNFGPTSHDYDANSGKSQDPAYGPFGREEKRDGQMHPDEWDEATRDEIKNRKIYRPATINRFQDLASHLMEKTISILKEDDSKD
jgi:hypothetical protein